MGFGFEISERQGGTGREPPLVVGRRPAGFGVVEPLVGSFHQRSRQGEVSEGASEDDRRVAGHIHVLQRCGQEGFGFASAGGTPVEDFKLWS